MKSNKPSQQIKKPSTRTKEKIFQVILKLGLVKIQRKVEIEGNNFTPEYLNKVVRRKYSSIINMGGTVSLIQEQN